MRAYIGNARQLQQALDGAVFSVFAVEHRKHHIDLLPDHAVSLKGQQALAPDGRDGRLTVVGVGQPAPAGQVGIVLAAVKDPLPLLGNAHGKYIVLALIDIVQHGLGAAQGHLVLRTHAAEENANA